MMANRITFSCLKVILCCALCVVSNGVIAQDSASPWEMNYKWDNILVLNKNPTPSPADDIQGSENTAYNTSLRAMAAYHHEGFTGNIHALVNYGLSSDVITPTARSLLTRYRGVDLRWDAPENEQFRFTGEIDRLNAAFFLPGADITIGRQALSFGKAFFWNPLDVFLPFSPAQLDRDYKPGVDALSIEIPQGDFSGIGLFGVLGSEDNKSSPSWDGSSLLARYFTTVKGTDISVQAGKVFAGYHVGAGASGEVGKIELRGEASYFRNDNDITITKSYASMVLGTGYRFDNSLHLQMEYFYNGAGSKDPNAALVRLGQGLTTNLSKNILGSSASYEFTPLMTGRVAIINSLDDGSFFIQPDITYSASDESEFLVSVAINKGDRPTINTGTNAGSTLLRSEYGSYPNTLYFQYKLFF